MTYPCPNCGAPANLDTGCPRCGRGPDPEAAEVIRLDQEIAVLLKRRHSAATRIHNRPPGFPPPRTTLPAMAPSDAPAAPPRTTVPAMTASDTPGAPPRTTMPAMAASDMPAVPPRATRSPEASTKLVQTALFLLGGLLLGVAAIVFTAVAWSQFGVGGRAALLGLFTLVALAAPVLAVRRGLTATAETFAAVGLLLVLLDGYAAWHVNLFGLAGFSATGYAGAVCAVTAAIATGYEHLTGLTGPRYAALVVAQPVLPLVVAPLHPDRAGWAFALAGVAALNLAVLHLRPRRLTGVGIAAYVFGALAAGVSGLTAVAQLVLADAPGPIATAACALVTAAGIVLAGAVLARVGWILEVAAGLVVVAVAIAAGRLTHWYAPILFAATIAAIGVAVSLLPHRIGARVAALAVLPTAALVLAADGFSRSLPAGLLLLTAGMLAVWRVPGVAVVGVTLAVLAAPESFGWVWWSAPIAYLLVAAAVLALVVRAVVGPWLALAAAVPAGLAVLIAAGSPVAGAATLGGLVVLGLGTAVAARRGVVGGVALTVALLAAPGAAAWAIGPDVWQARVALGVTGLVVGAVHLCPRAYRGFAVAGALPLLAMAPLAGFLADEPLSVYAAVALLLLATIDGTAALVVAAPLAVAAIAGLGSVIFTAAGFVRWPDVVSVLLLTSAAVVAARVHGRRDLWWVAAPGIVIVVPLVVAAARVPWPGVPAAALAAGLGGLLAVALGRRMRVTVPVAAMIAGSGLAGLADTQAAMRTGLAAIVVSGAVAGAVGRLTAARLAGWLSAVAAGLAMAGTADLPLAEVAFVVLAVAFVALALGTVLTIRRSLLEGRAVQAAAHAGAVVALLLTAGSARHAAAICTLWGVALGLRALAPGARKWHALAATVAQLGAWWLLISAERVAVLEAYTVPAAAVALLAGWLALRSRPGLSSWVSVGPALAAGLLPTLASVLTGEGQPLRRLLLGSAALAVVLAGARWRLQAPVVTGGVVLTLVALHEIALVWDLLPRWIPLAAAGLLLVGLATTLERRRRDVSRVRAALIRMS